MRIEGLLIGAASLTLLAGAATAQSTQQVDPPQSPVTTPNSMQATPATTDQNSRTTLDMTTTSTMPAPDTSSMSPTVDTTTTPTRMYTNSAGVNVQVISNGPVPDTPENRAKYGKPLSHAGKRTAPAGN